MNKIYFISFATRNMKFALKRIGLQAKKFNCFEKIILYSERKLPAYAKKRCKEIIKKTGTKRGYAYWSWKSVIINQTLNCMENGDILIYCDAGNHLNINGKQKLLDEYIPQAIKNDIWAIKLQEDLPDVNWTKIDTIDFFKSKILEEKISDFNQQIHEGQLEAGTIILVKNKYTCSLMKKWEEYMSLDNLHLFDDSKSIIDEPEYFCQHRHDQSVFSLLLKSNHYTYTGVEHFYSSDDVLSSNSNWKQLKESEPFLRMRDVKKK